MARVNDLLDDSKIIKKDNKIDNSKDTVNINNNIVEEINQNFQNIVIEEKPVYNFEKNQHTKKIEVTPLKQTSGISINIPKDQLKIIYVNTIKYENELQLEIEILNLLLNNKDDQFEFYKNKLQFIQNEIIFIKNKKNVLEKILK